MSTYVSLIKFTDQGIKNIKNNQKDAEEAIKMGEKLGGKVIGLYYLMGEYDVILIYECPSDEVALISALSASLKGSIKTTTLKAFTMEEFEEILKKLP